MPFFAPEHAGQPAKPWAQVLWLLAERYSNSDRHLTGQLHVPPCTHHVPGNSAPLHLGLGEPAREDFISEQSPSLFTVPPASQHCWLYNLKNLCLRPEEKRPPKAQMRDKNTTHQVEKSLAWMSPYKYYDSQGTLVFCVFDPDSSFTVGMLIHIAHSDRETTDWAAVLAYQERATGSMVSERGIPATEECEPHDSPFHMSPQLRRRTPASLAWASSS